MTAKDELDRELLYSGTFEAGPKTPVRMAATKALHNPVKAQVLFDFGGSVILGIEITLREWARKGAEDLLEEWKETLARKVHARAVMNLKNLGSPALE